MVTTVEGVFRDGRIELREPPPDVEEARVMVTFLPETAVSEAGSPRPSEANRRMLGLLKSWQAEPLTAEERGLLDEFEAFQAAETMIGLDTNVLVPKASGSRLP